MPANLYVKYFSKLVINSVRKRAVRVHTAMKQNSLHDTQAAVIFSRKSVFSRAQREAVVLRWCCAEAVEQICFKTS